MSSLPAGTPSPEYLLGASIWAVYAKCLISALSWALGAIVSLGDESLRPPAPGSLVAEASEGLVPPLLVGSCPEPSALKNLDLV